MGVEVTDHHFVCISLTLDQWYKARLVGVGCEVDVPRVEVQLGADGR